MWTIDPEGATHYAVDKLGRRAALGWPSGRVDVLDLASRATVESYSVLLDDSDFPDIDDLGHLVLANDGTLAVSVEHQATQNGDRFIEVFVFPAGAQVPQKLNVWDLEGFRDPVWDEPWTLSDDGNVLAYAFHATEGEAAWEPKLVLRATRDLSEVARLHAGETGEIGIGLVAVSGDGSIAAGVGENEVFAWHSARERSSWRKPGSVRSLAVALDGSLAVGEAADRQACWVFPFGGQVYGMALPEALRDGRLVSYEIEAGSVRWLLQDRFVEQRVTDGHVRVSEPMQGAAALYALPSIQGSSGGLVGLGPGAFAYLAVSPSWGEWRSPA